MRDRIVMAYEAVRTMEGLAQPAVKRLVTVHGNEMQVFMEIVARHDDAVDVNNNAHNGPVSVTPEHPRPHGNNAPTHQVLLSLIGQTNSLHRAITE